MKDKAVLGGSIMAAIAASLCCIGPLVAVVLGLGTFSAAAAFEALRPYLIALTALLLTGAFYLTYRNRTVTCEDGACQVRGASRSSKILVWLATAAVVVFATFPYYSGALLRANTQKNDWVAKSNATSDAASSGDSTVVVKVTGMTCDACALHVHDGLANVPGVKSADVSYEKGQAVVAYDPGDTNTDAIRAAIDATGYKAGEVTSDTPEASVSSPTVREGSQAKILLSASVAHASERVSRIRVLGMYCTACAKGVEASLKSKDGVKDVQVKFSGRAGKPSLVTVTYDDEKITEEKLRELIRESGFKPVVEKKRS